MFPYHLWSSLIGYLCRTCMWMSSHSQLKKTCVRDWEIVFQATYNKTSHMTTSSSRFNYKRGEWRHEFTLCFSKSQIKVPVLQLLFALICCTSSVALTVSIPMLQQPYLYGLSHFDFGSKLWVKLWHCHCKELHNTTNSLRCIEVS